MRLSAWTAALRIARREAWRAKARSLLVIALVGAPVFLLAGVDVVYRTWQLDPSETITRAIGHADARLEWNGLTVTDQTPNPNDGGWGGEGSYDRPAPTTSQVAALFPAGSKVIADNEAQRQLEFRTAAGIADATFIGLDYADPIAGGLVHQHDGRAPGNRHEVALTAATARSTGLRIGDTLHAIDPARDFTIVGVVSPADNRDTQAVYSVPAAFAAPVPSPSVFTGERAWLVNVPSQVSWADVMKLNAAGFVVTSRDVILHPPPASAVPEQDRPQTRAISQHALATGTLVGGMVLLEIVLLAGPAFAVGARRRRRELALIAAVGGGRNDLRRVVLADAVVLGLASGASAVVAGIAGAAVAERIIDRHVAQPPGHFDIPVLDLTALVAVSLITALLAAAFPAHRAAQTDVVSALAGRRGIVRTRARTWLLGAALAAAGVAVASGALGSPTASLVLVGVALVELGVIVGTPALIGLVALGARWLPVSPRIALRDAGRNRMSAAPAVAAVMASVIGAVAAVIGLASATAHSRHEYVASLPARDTYVNLLASADAPTAVAAARRAFPGDPVTTVDSVADECGDVEDSPDDAVGTPCTTVSLTYPGNLNDPGRYHGSALSSVVVDDGSAVDRLFGEHEPNATAALRAGRAVVLDGSAVRNGRIVVTVAKYAGTGQVQLGDARHVTLPVTVIDTGFPITEVILPRSVADRLGVAVAPDGVLVSSSTAVSSKQRQALAAGLAPTGHRFQIFSETGYHDPSAWLPLVMVGVAGLIAVFAALIATALANIDSRADLITLAAVGAGPRTRRVLSMARAVVITGLGTGIGTVAGILPASAWVRSTTGALVIPWTLLATAAVGIPAIAGLLAALFTRARLPAEGAS